jgi:hypothetical protein
MLRYLHLQVGSTYLVELAFYSTSVPRIGSGVNCASKAQYACYCLATIPPPYFAKPAALSVHNHTHL